MAEDHVQLEVTLPWLLHKFAQVVQQAAVAFSSKRNNSAALLAAATPSRRVKNVRRLGARE